MMLLSRLCPLSEDSCYLGEEAINHCSGNGALFLALPWMTLGKMMTLCALVSYSVLSFDVVPEAYVKNSVHGLLLFKNYFPSS